MDAYFKKRFPYVCETRGKIDTPLKRNVHETRTVQTLVI